MPSLFVTRSMMRHKSEEKEGAGPGQKSLVQCPHCSKHFAHGGEVEAHDGTSPESGAHEFDREHEEEMGYAERTRKYDREYDHYYGAGEASRAERIAHKGGESNESFTSYLAKRRAARGR